MSLDCVLEVGTLIFEKQNLRFESLDILVIVSKCERRRRSLVNELPLLSSL